MLGNQFHNENLDHIGSGVFCDLTKCWMQFTGFLQNSGFPNNELSGTHMTQFQKALFSHGQLLH